MPLRGERGSVLGFIPRVGSRYDLDWVLRSYPAGLELGALSNIILLRRSGENLGSLVRSIYPETNRVHRRYKLLNRKRIRSNCPSDASRHSKGQLRSILYLGRPNSNAAYHKLRRPHLQATSW